MEGVRLSVIIPCRDEAGRIGAQLERLARERWSEPWEIIVADNGSTDATTSVVRAYQERLKDLELVDASARPGATHARNVGTAAARGDLVVFCDADDEIQPGWLAAMGDALQTHDVVVGRLDSQTLNGHWAVTLRGLPQDEGLIPFGRHLPFGASSNLGVRRLLHDRIGGFDEDFLGATHDTDYCWRLQRAGVKLHFEPQAVVSYRLREDLGSLFRQARFYAVGVVSMYKKYRHDVLPEQRRPWLAGLLTWLGLVTFIPIPPRKPALARFVWALGLKIGMVEGSIRNRVVLLTPRGIL